MPKAGTNGHVFAALHSYDDYRHYRNALSRLQRRRVCRADTALPVELADVLTAELRHEYGGDEHTHPVDPRCIPFTLNQLHSVNSTIQKRAAGGQ